MYNSKLLTDDHDSLFSLAYCFIIVYVCVCCMNDVCLKFCRDRIRCFLELQSSVKLKTYCPLVCKLVYHIKEIDSAPSVSHHKFMEEHLLLYPSDKNMQKI